MTEEKQKELDKYPVVVDIKIAGVEPIPGWIEEKIEEFMKKIWAIHGNIDKTYSHRITIQHPKNVRSIILKFYIRRRDGFDMAVCVFSHSASLYYSFR